MIRKIGVGVLLVGWIGFVALLSVQAGGKAEVALKVLVPDKDAKLSVNGKDQAGDGEERRLKVPFEKGKDTLVDIAFKPNGYTDIFRNKKLTLSEDDLKKEIVVDLRNPDPKNPDRIKVIFVGSPEAVVEKMLETAKVGKDDIVYDLGSGDGRIVIMASQKFNAKRGVGIDIDPKMVEIAKDKAKLIGTKNVDFFQGDILDVKALKGLEDASVVTLWVGRDLNIAVAPILKKVCKPGTRVVSHQFDMGDWKPDVTVRTPTGHEVYLWLIKKAEK